MKSESNIKALSKPEFVQLLKWLSIDPSQVQDPMIMGLLRRLVATYGALNENERSAKSVLFLLRQQMGFIPKSERGAQAASVQGPQPPARSESSALPEGLEDWDPQVKDQYFATQRKRAESLRQARLYGQELKQLRPVVRTPGPQMELDLSRPSEGLFAAPLIQREAEREARKVDRMLEFGKSKGFHHAKDSPKRIDLQFIAKEITYDVETLTDLTTGKSVRASTQADGPDGSGMTWRSIANLVKLHVGFAIPINRLALMIGQPEFSSGKIFGILRDAAHMFVEIYLHLADQMADLSLISGDDTKTKVLVPHETTKPKELCERVDAQLGYQQPLANGSGDKKALNVSLLIGKTDSDPRSTIRFFRTHIGSVGNLLTKILEARNPKAGPIIFQGDLSTTNLPSPEVQLAMDLMIGGCGAHARRPFWRYRADDESLCYFVLRCFLALSRIESRIDAEGRNRENTLRLRGRYGRMIWLAIKNRCTAATTGEKVGPATYPNGITPNIWPPKTELNQACNYVIRHFEELTLYLKHPEMDYTNNVCERGLRIEKLMLAASKFRKTKHGRITLDILRT